MSSYEHRSIGIIHSPFKEPKGTPIQPPAGAGIAGTIEIFPEYAEGLTDIGGFSHLILLYHLHLIQKSSLVVKPFLDTVTHGVFATRSPGRPNHIGLSIVRLIKVTDNVLHIQDMDILDGTPLFDIKPYVPDFDQRTDCRIGWMCNNVTKLPTMRDDGRFLT
jgi:tRNA-Thr(GGU) m(6)t(6)A37 methyltransferase TsaA